MRSVSLAALATTLIAMAVPALAQDTADRIWTGGPILTMNDGAMRADAVAEKDGKIVAVGSNEAVMALKGEKTQVIDLAGRALLPGFVDAHGHVFMGGLQALSANLLAPPDGNVTDMASLIDVLRKWVDENREIVEKANLIIGFGYDNATLAEHRHPTREDLDKVSTEFPIYLVHQSGHFGATNSKALEVVGITKVTRIGRGKLVQGTKRDMKRNRRFDRGKTQDTLPSRDDRAIPEPTPPLQYVSQALLTAPRRHEDAEGTGNHAVNATAEVTRMEYRGSCGKVLDCRSFEDRPLKRSILLRQPAALEDCALCVGDLKAQRSSGCVVAVVG